MSGKSWLAAGAALAAAGAIGLVLRPSGAPRPVAERPVAVAERPALALLTSLPLVFGERFGLESGGSPALTRLEQRYRVQPIGVADAASLKGRKLLLMAHPRAQPATALVDLDRWVREGGRLVLLADPKLDWPSERPLGDVLRPPPAFADTGLLAHWGLRLIAPEPGSAVTAGRLENRGSCMVEEDGILARCKLGKGEAVIIADADFLNVETSDSENLDPLVAELDRLEIR